MITMAKEKPQTFGLITEPTKLRTFTVKASRLDTFDEIWTKQFKAKDMDNLRKNLIAAYKEQAFRTKDGMSFRVLSGNGASNKRSILYIWKTAIGRGVFQWMTDSMIHHVEESTGKLMYGRRI